MSYTDTATIKKYLGVNFTSSLDSYVEGVIDSIVEYIERYCGDERFGKRIFEAPDSDDDVTYLFDGNGAERLYIGDLRSITTLAVSFTFLTACSKLDNVNNFLFLFSLFFLLNSSLLNIFV